MNSEELKALQARERELVETRRASAARSAGMSGVHDVVQADREKTARIRREQQAAALEHRALEQDAGLEFAGPPAVARLVPADDPSLTTPGYILQVSALDEVDVSPVEGYGPYVGGVPLTEIEQSAYYDRASPARHPNSARYHELLEEIGELHDRKQADYGRGGDPFANVRASSEWGMASWVGAMVRLTDKVRRLQSLATKGSLANEAAKDSFLDIAVYALIAYVLYEEDEDESTQC